MALIHIENKIDVAELADVLTREHRQTAIELLTLIKHEFNARQVINLGEDWRGSYGVSQIAKLYSINLNYIQ